MLGGTHFACASCAVWALRDLETAGAGGYRVGRWAHTHWDYALDGIAPRRAPQCCVRSSYVSAATAPACALSAALHLLLGRMPPPRDAVAVCAELNRRFLLGKTYGGSWHSAGVLMWVLDGDGTLNGLPSASMPEPWMANASSKTGDRHSATLVNRWHPRLFHSHGTAHNPGLVLSPSLQTMSRILCLYHHDVGTLRFQCPSWRAPQDARHDSAQRLAQPACIPGCSPHICNEGPSKPNDPWFPMPARHWCHWRSSQLREMMAAQDRLLPMSFDYNEVVLDSWRQPWAPDLSEIVEAVFIQATAPRPQQLQSRWVREAVANATRIGLPLVLYDPRTAARWRVNATLRLWKTSARGVPGPFRPFV